MSKVSAVFLMALAAACLLITVGLLGVIDADCPRPIGQFPMSQLNCNVLISLTGAGLLLLAIGAVGISASVIWDALSESKGVGRNA